MAKVISKKDYRKDGSTNIKGYAIALSKKGVEEESEISEKDELKIKYSKNKIDIEKVKK